MTASDSSATFAAIAAELQAESDRDMTARTIVERMVDVVPGADRVSLTVRTRGAGHVTLAASDELAQLADDLQYRLDEGPCIDTADDGGWVRSGDVSRDPRWPRWGPEARALGVGSLLSVQLLADGRPHGALNLYGDAVGRFADHDTIDIATVYAVHAANALTSARMVSDLQTALSSRHTIGMAQGILMQRYGLSEAQSFELLRRVSSTNETKLRDVATHVVVTGTLPDIADDTSS